MEENGKKKKKKNYLRKHSRKRENLRKLWIKWKMT